jgi:hypothetical protein
MGRTKKLVHRRARRSGCPLNRASEDVRKTEVTDGTKLRGMKACEIRTGGVEGLEADDER